MSRRRAPDGLTFWWRLGVVVVGAVLRSLFRYWFVGLDRIPEHGAAILAANHLSMLDGVFLAFAPASSRRRPISFLVAAEFFRNAFVGFFLRRFGQIPIRRGEGDSGALDGAIATIRAGALAGIFPEGRINEGTTLQPGRTGIARIALASGAPVIPVGIWGTQYRWPRGHLTIRRPIRTRVALFFGEPIEPTGDPESQEDLQIFTDLVMTGLALEVSKARADVEGRR